MSISEILEVIQDKKEKYIASFLEEPKYIKIPKWVYSAITMYHNMIRAFAPDMSEDEYDLTIMGMIAIPTSKIEQLEDIEIF